MIVFLKDMRRRGGGGGRSNMDVLRRRVELCRKEGLGFDLDGVVVTCVISMLIIVELR